MVQSQSVRSVHSNRETQPSQALGRAPAASRCAMRMVRSGQEIDLVYQAETPGAVPTLVFESPSGTKTVTRFPADWRRLSDSELLRLRGDRDD